MGKRGGRRRKKASTTSNAYQQVGDHDHDSIIPSTDKRQKVDHHDDIAAGKEVPIEIIDNTQVVVMGIDEDNDPMLQQELPPSPFSIEDFDEMKEAGSANHHLNAIWKYLGNRHKRDGVGTVWKPSNIQRYLWPILLRSQWNTIGVASTGSGKTLAYAIPTTTCSDDGSILVLVPTRELVQQVSKVFQKVIKAVRYVKYNNNDNNNDTTMTSNTIPIVTIHGGTNRVPQQQALKEASTFKKAIIIATPGRLLDLVQEIESSNTCSVLPQLFSWIILDEADQLAKDGDLGPQVDKILTATRQQSETTTMTTRMVLVSATYPDRARSKFQQWVGMKHVLIQVDYIQQTSGGRKLSSSGHHQQQQQQQQQQHEEEDNSNTDDKDKYAHRNAGSFARIPSHLEQVLHVCAEHKKPRKLIHTLHQIYNKKYSSNPRSRPLGIVFFSKIDKLKHVSRLLIKEGIMGIVPLHSQLSSTKIRQSNLAQFACGQKPLLLATDVAARGIDIPSVKFVIQYDFPGNLQQYVHRCGRAGRSSSFSSSSSSSSNMPKPTIYSFFTRNLQAMAPDLIRLLEANQAWVDPNLRSLAQEGDNTGNNESSKSKSKSNKAKIQNVHHALDNNNNNKDDDIDEVQDDFPDLAPNKIAFQRASHVSDASSSSSSDDDDQDDDDDDDDSIDKGSEGKETT